MLTICKILDMLTEKRLKKVFILYNQLFSVLLNVQQILAKDLEKN